MPDELIPNQKKKLFWSVLFCYTTTVNHFSIRQCCAMESGFYITSDDQLSGWTEKKLQSTSQSQTCTKKRPWSLFGGLLLVWSTTAFWILAKPLCLRSTLSKLMLLSPDSVWPHRQQPTMLCRPWDSPGKNTGSGLPFPSPMHESEKWKWSRPVVSDS